MATMIPKKPNDFTPASLEDVMFEALRELPEEYYVFHSFQLAMHDTFENGTRTVREADFIIFNPSKGIICLEAKAGQVRYQDGDWLYSSGDMMKHGGPFKQAKSVMWELSKLIALRKGSAFEKKCKFYHAVWFPSVTHADLNLISLPAEAPMQIILTKESLKDILPAIEGVYDYNLCHGTEMTLSDIDVKSLITRVLCPKFDIIPTASFETDLKKLTFSRLLKEQTNILNFMVEQRCAVINGAAGTGKTMIALARAQMNARQGDSVLFLCYNRKLKDFLSVEYKEENICFYTIDGLACYLCDTAAPDYVRLESRLSDFYREQNFPFKHIVIDEGQDFGKEGLEEINIIRLLRDIIMDREDESGTFYIFYDRLQMVAAQNLPTYIVEADCKMTLYRNCRNTEQIASTSLKPISERKPKLIEGALPGEAATIRFCGTGNSVAAIDNAITALKSKSFENIVILTAKTLSSSSISSLLQGPSGQEKYRGSIPAATCRTFKGLEADAVILIDVDKSSFEGDGAMLFYVGASRARLSLQIVTDMDDEQLDHVLRNDLNKTNSGKNIKRAFAAALGAVGFVEPT